MYAIAVREPNVQFQWLRRTNLPWGIEKDIALDPDGRPEWEGRGGGQHSPSPSTSIWALVLCASHCEAKHLDFFPTKVRWSIEGTWNMC